MDENITLVNSDEYYKIKNLKPKPSTGFDISFTFVKNSQHYFKNFFIFFLNLILTSGQFLDKLKIAKVIPLFKAGNKKLVLNYQPISLFSTIDKKNRPISDSQLTE